MMNFIRAVNYFMFTRTYSVFECIAIFIIVHLMDLSLWHILWYIPVIWLSVHMQKIIEIDQNG
jgi:hypothetical protein